MKNCSSGEDQSRTCLKCCAPSNSMMILYSGIQKSKGRWSSLLHPSCLDSSNGWDLVKEIANYFPEKFLAILEEVFPIVTSTAKNADVTKEVLAIEVRFDLSKLGHSCSLAGTFKRRTQSEVTSIEEQIIEAVKGYKLSYDAMRLHPS